ncbi:MAG: repair protein RecO protein [Candidatus Woesebacteria bacterium GW2011_GWD1_41_12]|uniref:DNA repair protein RecO n=4 Tax=Candidatus Woeseibacteriota TaxID=1752722 RepID=A0A0G0WW41_9BACT|nr:MAG: repair protein RecO protein [Candidatus Woesebacteria bacterium GW2011_GWD1_41_12]KKS03716.1 MAG: repair protein RecO protein [Candidatus Woesebacteria bacterium GW2011_GWE1_41_24]KKS16944.1 MAG: repair protein RecO protein [Candidatus Woesebacteria bacterium GW2011_GWA1_41_7]OGM81007.1 MAG: DNA repair protein RecO [Candidatus Woesebacteria bacterium RIFOXYB1_FULL_41_13]
MIPRSYVSEGFVLARRNFKEADRILDIYSKDKGKVSLIAKGIRRPGSRKRGHLEIFSRIKFQAISGKGMGIMTEVETIDDFESLRKSIKKVSLAYYFVEVLSKATHEGEGNIELYNFISDLMEKLKTAKKLKDLRLEFVTQLLKILGYWPRDKELPSPDAKLDEVIERQIYSKRVGKMMLE